MFSVRQKREISEQVQSILRTTNHPELPRPEFEIRFLLHVDGAGPGSWADIRNNENVKEPTVNPWNEQQDDVTSVGCGNESGAPLLNKVPVVGTQEEWTVEKFRNPQGFESIDYSEIFCGHKLIASDQIEEEAREIVAAHNASLAQLREEAILAKGYLEVRHHNSSLALREELEAARKNYQELILSVQSKYPDETRHETALRYIKERELRSATQTGCQIPSPEDLTC